MKNIIYLPILLSLLISCRTAKKAESSTEIIRQNAVGTTVVRSDSARDSLFSVLDGHAERIVIRRPSGDSVPEIIILHDAGWKISRERKSEAVSDTKTVISSHSDTSTALKNTKKKDSAPAAGNTLKLLILLFLTLLAVRIGLRH